MNKPMRCVRTVDCVMFVEGVSEGGEGRGEVLGRCEGEGGEADEDGDREVEG